MTAFPGAGPSKVQSVDQRMRLERGVGFRQLLTCRRIRGSCVPIVLQKSENAG